MNPVLGGLWTFIMFQLVAGFLYYQHDYDRGAFTLFFRHKSSAPFLLLQIGMVIYIILLFLYFKHLVDLKGTENSYPILFVEKVPVELKRFWEINSLIAVNVIPWFGFIWMWYAFFRSDQSVWNGSSKNVVGIFDIVSSPASFLGGWNNYRYGRFPDEGDSFVPYWQPVLIMWPLTLAAVVFTVANIARFFGIQT